MIEKQLQTSWTSAGIKMNGSHFFLEFMTPANSYISAWSLFCFPFQNSNLLHLCEIIFGHTLIDITPSSDLHSSFCKQYLSTFLWYLPQVVVLLYCFILSQAICESLVPLHQQLVKTDFFLIIWLIYILFYPVVYSFRWGVVGLCSPRVLCVCVCVCVCVL